MRRTFRDNRRTSSSPTTLKFFRYKSEQRARFKKNCQRKQSLPFVNNQRAAMHLLNGITSFAYSALVAINIGVCQQAKIPCTLLGKCFPEDGSRFPGRGPPLQMVRREMPSCVRVSSFHGCHRSAARLASKMLEHSLRATWSDASIPTTPNADGEI